MQHTHLPHTYNVDTDTTHLCTGSPYIHTYATHTFHIRHTENIYHTDILHIYASQTYTLYLPYIYMNEQNLGPGNVDACTGSPYMAVLLNLSLLGFTVSVDEDN